MAHQLSRKPAEAYTLQHPFDELSKWRYSEGKSRTISSLGQLSAWAQSYRERSSHVSRCTGRAGVAQSKRPAMSPSCSVFGNSVRNSLPSRVHKLLGEYEIGCPGLAKNLFLINRVGWVSFLLHPLPSARVWAPVGRGPRKLVP